MNNILSMIIMVCSVDCSIHQYSKDTLAILHNYGQCVMLNHKTAEVKKCTLKGNGIWKIKQ